jgi:hypothetical protein
MLAYDYPLLGIFWTMLWFFLFVVWIILLFRIFADIFRSDDMGGWGKALWSIFIIILPFLGVLIYVIVRGHGMSERDLKQAQAQKAAFDDYVRQTAGSSSTSVADELSKLAALKDQGVITEAEYTTLKAKAMG